MHIYFHGECFDGVASAALLRHFFLWRGERHIFLFPCSYRSNFASFWEKYRFQSPAAIVDFRYHPQADWWFDHHQTTFLKPEWEKNFSTDRQHCFDPQAPSCFGLTLNFLEKTYGYQAPAFLRKIKPWADKIDGMLYVSAPEALTFNSWEKQLSLLLNYYRRVYQGDIVSWQREIVEAIANGRIASLCQNRLGPAIKKLKKKIKHSRTVYQRASQIEGNIAFIDLTEYDLVLPELLGYALFPELSYTVSVSQEGHDFHLRVGWNPWSRQKNLVDLGELAKKYGGGGHYNVGALEVKTKSKALKIAGEIVKYLNKHESP